MTPFCLAETSESEDRFGCNSK